MVKNNVLVVGTVGSVISQVGPPAGSGGSSY